MSYYKINTTAALAAWDEEQRLRNELVDNGTAFAALFGAKPIFTTDLTRFSFYGVVFPDTTPTYGDPAIWTKPDSTARYTCRPRQKPPKGLGEESRSLLKMWNENFPSPSVDRDPYFKSLGLDWGMLFLCGLAHFRHGDIIYFNTGATPKEDSGAIEILGTEYKDAENTFNDESKEAT
ncbi:hypothetical protein [Yersinia aleksiciae]|uniref:hypothetical protein n=1 Tax=Yersinia aleksiciae TaxID=263819 RepID=UPI0011A56148|nr:hypothetical protein [Yersinia aleksiciae]